MSAAQLGGAAAATAGVAGWYLMNQRAKRQDALLTMVSEAAQAQAGIDSLAQSTYDELSRQRQETPRAPKRQPDASAASGASDGAAAGKGKAAAAPAAGQRSAAAAETKTAHAMSKAAAAVKPYPAVEPYRTGRLRVSETHEICFYESGNPNGNPVVVVHGGPGGGSVPSDRQFFDPAVYRIIQFDQRGCGKSTPHASLERNTTWDLIADMERLRAHLGVDKWMLFGGSWGSTLSLAYAESYPKRVTAMVLRGIFMLRKEEIDWYYQRGASFLFPDRFAEYESVIPPEERGNLVAAFRKVLTGEDKAAQERAATAWTKYEMATSTLITSEERLKKAEDGKFCLSFARIENHYFINRGFFPTDTYLLDFASRLHGIPAVIVHGRYDVVCPYKNAYDLHKVWPTAELRVVPDAGHSSAEPGIARELLRATDKFRDL